MLKESRDSMANLCERPPPLPVLDMLTNVAMARVCFRDGHGAIQYHLKLAKTESHRHMSGPGKSRGSMYQVW